MNVLIINNFFWGGGAEKISRQLYDGLSRRDDINCFFLAGKEGENIQADKTIYHKGSVLQEINHLCCKVKKGQRERDLYAANMIIHMIYEKKIDIVHFHNIHGDYIGIKDISRIARHCKIIWTLHDMWAFTGHCAYSCHCEKWKYDSCRNCVDLQLYPSIRADIAEHVYKIKKKSFTNKSINFVFPSDWLRKQCEQSFLAGERKTLIYNGVNTDLYYPVDKTKLRSSYGISLNKLVLLFAANNTWSLYKGVEILENALCKIKRKEEYELVIVGNAREFLFSEEYTCHYMGYIQSDDKMNELYNLADVFVIPSRAENFPCTVIESMAASTPVIASNVGGIAEQIDEDTGWLFEMGNINQLAGIIEALIDDKNRLVEMGINCRRKAEKFFSEEKMLKSYLTLYDDIANSTYRS